MLVCEFMHSPAVTCTSDATLEHAAREMDRFNVGCLVVVSANGHLVGIVTDRDIAVKGMGWGHDAATPVDKVMTRSVATIQSSALISEVASKMALWGVRRMPVVDVSGELKGVIALDDVTTAMSNEIGFLRKTVSTQTSGGRGWDES
jgi:CBS domain-containing protein